MRALLTQDELGRIEAAVRGAERGTTAEIVVVVAGGTAEAGWLLGPALAALAIPMPVLLAWPRLTPGTLYTVQLAVLAAGLLLGLIPGLRRLLRPGRVRRERTRRLARVQFFERGLHLTAARTGVLLLVAPVDRCAEVIADAGAEGSLPDEIWSGALQTLLAEARQGRLAAGIEAALGTLGEALRARLPADQHDRNEVPDRPVLL
jgi:putative membrane protein